MDYTTLTIEERSAKALSLAHSLIYGREREFARIGKIPKDDPFWDESQKIEDERIAELQLVCEGLNGDSDWFAVFTEWDYAGKCLCKIERKGNIVFYCGTHWIYKDRKHGFYHWGGMGFASTYRREEYTKMLTKQRELIHTRNYWKRDKNNFSAREKEFFAKQKELRKAKSKRLSDKQYCEEIGKTISIFLNTGWKDELKFEVDGSQVCINQSQAQAWEKCFPEKRGEVVCIV
jgi:hypothetical protein